jgi:lysyl-tRNA synthetase class 2
METLRRRAAMLAEARGFFARRDVLEVETPALVTQPVTDIHLANIQCRHSANPGRPLFLHTSAEYHMKRLLAAGSPDLYQICKVFRDGEAGSRHLPEFTMIEWYRKGLVLETMAEETCGLVRDLCRIGGRNVGMTRRFHYAELMLNHTGIDPLSEDRTGMIQRAAVVLRERPGSPQSTQLEQSLGADVDAWLDLLMVEIIEPALRSLGLVIVDRYPARQAALARLAPDDQRVAERFEIFLDGIELANGYRELTDWEEQRRRFMSDCAARRARSLEQREPDLALIAALKAGLPDCCGVALGFDRLVMCALGLTDITQAVSFPAGAPG